MEEKRNNQIQVLDSPGEEGDRAVNGRMTCL